jgi:2-iminoacetate synthase ThiH
MMYGIGETLAERIEHLERVRAVQARTNGFTAFICWPLQPENTPDDVAHAEDRRAGVPAHGRRSRASCSTTCPTCSRWVTMGMKVGQMALRYGCNDFGSLMIEENVVSAANTTHRTTTDEIEHLIVTRASRRRVAVRTTRSSPGLRPSPPLRPREHAARPPAHPVPHRHRVRLASACPWRPDATGWHRCALHAPL